MTVISDSSWVPASHVIAAGIMMPAAGGGPSWHSLRLGLGFPPARAARRVDPSPGLSMAALRLVTRARRGRYLLVLVPLAVRRRSDYQH
jgi:hypothetical protein